jgi:sugar phosphate isomerase/epimerase
MGSGSTKSQTLSSGRTARLGLCWGCCPADDLFQLAAAAGASGFDEFSITADHYLKARADGLTDADIRAFLRDQDVTVGVIDPLISNLPGTPAPEDVRPDWRRFFELTAEDCFAAAAGVGARSVNLAHFQGAPVDVVSLGSAVRDFAIEANRRSLAVSLEFIPGTGFADFTTTLQIVEQVQAANVGVMFDVWHFLRSGGVLDQLVPAAAAHVSEVQLSDRRVSKGEPRPYVPMSQRLNPGEGDAPLEEILSALLDARPDLVIGVEVFTDVHSPAGAVAPPLARAVLNLLGKL